MNQVETNCLHSFVFPGFRTVNRGLHLHGRNLADPILRLIGSDLAPPGPHGPGHAEHLPSPEAGTERPAPGGQ